MTQPHTPPGSQAAPDLHPLARVMVSAPGSGQGKTTVATGLLAALSRDPWNLPVAGFKVGPDYIDPGYHALATGRPGRNLDPWLQGEEKIVPLLLHGARHPDPVKLAIIEGVMGLFDGKDNTHGFSSTAHVAELTDTPVILTVDISHAARSVAATVAGFAAFEEEIKVEGVILNKAGSVRHSEEVTRALKRLAIPVLGVLPRDAQIHVPSRHLGLVPAAERDEAAQALDVLATRIADNVDLAQVVKIAMRAPHLHSRVWDPAEAVAAVRAGQDGPAGSEHSATPAQHSPSPAQRPRIAVAGGRAFTFRYTETTELIEAAGCEAVEFDPLQDRALPADTAGIYLGGGFPEAHAAELATNTSMLASVREAIAQGTPTVAECAGLLYLCRELDGAPMVAAIDAVAAMGDTLTLGYRDADGTHAHEFHRTTVTPPQPPMPPNVHASYLHVHWAGHPELAVEFIDAVTAHAATRPDIHHHGDAEVDAGLADFAVNVRCTSPPDWLAEQIAATMSDLGAYPDPMPAREALAAFHRVDPSMVLPTNGAAEAFTLIAHALPGQHPVVVHPQFTEPEAALLAAGRTPHRHILPAPFHLDFAAFGGHNPIPVDEDDEVVEDYQPPAPMPVEDWDLLFIGNPTNPTGVLHHGESLRQLAGPGQILVVDEAFMDATPGEAESLIGAEMDNVLVVRSLTKTWGLAGLRAGYVVGDPRLIALLAAQQAPWSVSTPALAAMIGCASDRGLIEAQRGAAGLRPDRDHLVAGLGSVGWQVVHPAEAPFVLAETGDPHIRQRLREAGFALRRGDTFPGLGPTWVRVAVRDTYATDALVAAIRASSATSHG